MGKETFCLGRARDRLLNKIVNRAKNWTWIFGWWVGNVATNVKPSAARIAEERRNVGAERQVRLPVEVAALSATLPTHHHFSGGELYVCPDRERKRSSALSPRLLSHLCY